MVPSSWFTTQPHPEPKSSRTGGHSDQSSWIPRDTLHFRTASNKLQIMLVWKPRYLSCLLTIHIWIQFVYFFGRNSAKIGWWTTENGKPKRVNHGNPRSNHSCLNLIAVPKCSTKIENSDKVISRLCHLLQLSYCLHQLPILGDWDIKIIKSRTAYFLGIFCRHPAAQRNLQFKCEITFFSVGCPQWLHTCSDYSIFQLEMGVESTTWHTQRHFLETCFIFPYFRAHHRVHITHISLVGLLSMMW